MTQFVIFAIAAGAVLVLGIFIFIAKLFRKVEQGKALVVSTMTTVEVTFTGRVVVPVIHKAEIMDISVKTIEIERAGSDGLICRDNIRADIKVTFFVRVNKTKDDVIKVAQAIGCVRASDHKTLDELFSAKFSEALKTVGKQLDFVDLYTQRNVFRDQIIAVIGTDLNGYVLEDAAIDYLEQTPLEQLNANNILDAQGIRKITELTAIEHVHTNEFRRNEQKQIKKQDVEAAEAIYELERQQAEAAAKQKREIETVQAREQAETLKVQAEEKLKAETAQIKTAEEIGIQSQNQQRQIAVASKNRERVIAVETERVEKDRMIEVVAREREIELQRIAKDKAVENEKREIANVIRERIAVDKTVAEQEEAIKRLRLVEEANRTKEAMIITAEAEAQEQLVKHIKEAEANEKASVHKAKEQLTMAEAALEAADREARAKIRLADGLKAEHAATGLAEVQVKEADAVAEEKLGLAKVRVKEADATAEEKVGFVRAKVKEVDAAAEQKRGIAEAVVLREKGAADGEALRSRLKGEAEGLTEKAAAMRALDERSREHEEYRLKLEMDKQVALAKVEAQCKIAETQAGVLAEGLKHAKIDIVGGESIFFDRLVGAISAGKALDGFVDRSETVKTLFKDYLEGDGNLPADLKEILSNVDAGDVRDLTLTAALARFAAGSDEATQQKVARLLGTAQKLGLDKAKVGA